MKRLKRFIRAVEAFGLFVGFYLEKRLEEALGEKTPKPLLLVVAFLSLLAATKIFERLAQTAVGRWFWLRKSILGDNYIEGVWFNHVPIDPPVYGLLRIAFNDDSIGVEGEQYNKDAVLSATWHSEMAEFDGSTLTYAYKVIYVRDDQTHEIHGVSRISFAKVSHSGVPRSYNGHFQDAAAQKTFCFTGFLVDTPAVLEELDSPDGKHKAVATLISKFTQS